MTLLLKLFLFQILYACGNNITSFSSVCVNSQNFKILNLNCTVLLTLGIRSHSGLAQFVIRLLTVLWVFIMFLTFEIWEKGHFLVILCNIATKCVVNICKYTCSYWIAFWRQLWSYNCLEKNGKFSWTAYAIQYLNEVPFNRMLNGICPYTVMTPSVRDCTYSLPFLPNMTFVKNLRGFLRIWIRHVDRERLLLRLPYI